MSMDREAVLTADKPPELKFNFETVPKALTDKSRWVCWAWDLKDGRWNKTPKRPSYPHLNASSTDPTTWSSFVGAIGPARSRKIGIGYVLGDGIIGIDLDDCRDPVTGDLDEWAQRIVNSLKTYAEVSPSGTGVKLFVRGKLPEGHGTQFPCPDGKGKVEVYSTGRYFTVTGERLEGSPSDVCDCQFTLNALMRKFAEWKPKRPEPERSANGKTALDCDSDTQAKRARAYLKTIPGAVAGQGGHDATFRVAVKLASFGLTFDQAFDLIDEWNLRCEPPWSDAELRHKLDGAFKADPAPMPDRDPVSQAQDTGCDVSPMLTEGRADQHSAASGESSVIVDKPSQDLIAILEAGQRKLASGQSPADVWKFVKTSADRLTPVDDVQSFEFMTSEQLDAADLRIEYLVKGVLVKGQPCIFAAGKKMLKTNISIDLALSLASASKFLGQFWVPNAVRVAIMSGESGSATIQETARRIAKSKPWINLSDYGNVDWSFQLPKLGLPNSRASLEKCILDKGLDVLIIDPAYLCLNLGEGAGNLFQSGEKLSELSDAILATGCTIILVHHNRKSHPGEQYLPPELEWIAWSGFQEWARQWILLNRREPFNAEHSGSHRLWLNVGGSAGHAGLWGLDIEEGDIEDAGGRKWLVSINGASSTIAETMEQREDAKTERENQKLERQLTRNCGKLLKALEKFPDGETERIIFRKAGLGETAGSQGLDKLLSDGTVESCEVIKTGRTYAGIRLAKSSVMKCNICNKCDECACCTPGDVNATNSPIRGSSSSHISPDTETDDELVSKAFPESRHHSRAKPRWSPI